MKLSTSTGDFVIGNMPVEEQIKHIAEAGFKHVNLELADRVSDSRLDVDNWEERIESIGQAAKEAGVDFVQAHSTCDTLAKVSYETLVEETRRDIVACERLGIPFLVVHALLRSHCGARGIYELNKKYYNDLLDKVPDGKTRLLVENGGDIESNCTGFASGYDIAEFLDWMNEPRLGACLDTAHLNQNKPPRDDQYASITALGDWLCALHIADNFGRDLHWHTAPFGGIVNFDSVMCGLIDIGYKGAFNFESSYIMRNQKSPPLRRKEWTHPKDPDFVPKLMNPPLELKLSADRMLYAAGRYILEQYGLFEE